MIRICPTSAPTSVAFTPSSCMATPLHLEVSPHPPPTRGEAGSHSINGQCWVREMKSLHDSDISGTRASDRQLCPEAFPVLMGSCWVSGGQLSVRRYGDQVRPQKAKISRLVLRKYLLTFSPNEKVVLMPLILGCGFLGRWEKVTPGRVCMMWAGGVTQVN